jgi:hypothetical protein
MLKYIKFSIFLLLLNSCSGPSDTNNCVTNYKLARNNYADYFKNKDSSLLKQALSDIEKSFECQKTKRGAIDLKIALLSMLKEYKKDYEFIDSLNENDFSKKYKKNMNYNLFRALDYKERGDTINHNKLLNETIENIHNYIQQESMPQGEVDEEAYLDLFVMKKQLEKPEKIKAEINLLKKEYPQEGEFFDGLEGSLFEEPNEVNSSAPQ